MTIEEKAKAYDEALERARLLNADNMLSDEAIEEIFPQLAESEDKDERIRKLLVWQVHRNIEDETNDLARSVYDGIKGHDPDLEKSIEDWKKCLAWLEKQKENTEKEYVFRPLAGTDITIAAKQAIELAKKGDSLVFAFNGMYTPVSKYSSVQGLVAKYESWLKDQNPTEIDEYEIIKKHITEGSLSSEVNKRLTECGWYVTEQKPAEWSEEDEAFLKVAIAVCNKYSHKDIADWLESLRPQPKQKVNNMITPNKEFFQWIYDRLVNVHKEEPNVDYMISFKRQIEELSFDEPSWKPSEEQMKALLNIEGDLRAFQHNDKAKIIAELYEQLKKLM